MRTKNKLESQEDKQRLSQLFLLAKHQQCQSSATLLAILKVIDKRVRKYPNLAAYWWMAIPQAVMSFDPARGSSELTHLLNTANWLHGEESKANLFCGSVRMPPSRIRIIVKMKHLAPDRIDKLVCGEMGMCPDSLEQWLFDGKETL